MILKMIFDHGQVFSQLLKDHDMYIFKISFKNSKPLVPPANDPSTHQRVPHSSARCWIGVANVPLTRARSKSAVECVQLAGKEKGEGF